MSQIKYALDRLTRDRLIEILASTLARLDQLAERVAVGVHGRGLLTEGDKLGEVLADDVKLEIHPLPLR